MKKFGKRVKRRVRKILEKIAESVIGRFICDVLKHLFEDND